MNAGCANHAEIFLWTVAPLAPLS